MNFFDYLEDRFWTKSGRWKDESDQIVRMIKPGESERESYKLLGHDWGDGYKVIEAFIRIRETQTPILEYLNVIADLQFRERDSDSRYGGYYFYTAKQSHLAATVVPGIWLGFSAPRRYKNKEWYYVRIACSMNDTRFDSFPDYELAPANRYGID